MKDALHSLFYYEVGICGGPLVDLYETGDDLVFEVDLPGIDPANVSIKIYEDLLIIEGSRNDDNDRSTAGNLKYLCMERSTKCFRRVLKIPVHINTMAGNAYYTNGVITLKFPKLKGKLITVKLVRQCDGAAK